MMIKEIRSIIEQEADAVRRIPVTEHYTEAVDLIVKHVHDQGGKLITSGMGKAGQIAMNIATTFSSTGTPAFFLHPSEAQHGDLGIVCPNDVMLLVSNSRAVGAGTANTGTGRRYTVYCNHVRSGKPVSPRGCRMPPDRSAERGVCTGIDTHNINHRHDGDR